MSSKILNEIKDFNKVFNTGGITLEYYFNKKKQIKKKIDLKSEESLNFFRWLYFYDLITQHQYMEMKSKVDNSRKYYKSLLVI